MAFVDVGATYHLVDIPTKKALKEAIAKNPDDVNIYTTSAFEVPSTKKASELDKSDKYTVVGPNPYTSRKWYATLAWNAKKGMWVVS
jgi:hypothetical protein